MDLARAWDRLKPWAFVVTVVYAVGWIVRALDAGRAGYPNSELVRGDYLLTGIATLLFAAAPAALVVAPVWLAWSIARPPAQRLETFAPSKPRPCSRRRASVAGLSALLAVPFVTMALAMLLSFWFAAHSFDVTAGGAPALREAAGGPLAALRMLVHTYEGPDGLWVLSGWLLAAFLGADRRGRQVFDPGSAWQPIRTMARTAMGAAVVVCALLFVNEFSTVRLQRIPSTRGGTEPRLVLLHFRADTADAFASLAERRLLLVHQSSDTLFVQRRPAKEPVRRRDGEPLLSVAVTQVAYLEYVDK